MSVCSSASSERSITYDGVEQSVEQMLDSLIRNIQGGLNSLQMNLRRMCAAEDQALLDDDSDYKEIVALSDETEDLTALLVHYLTELGPVLHEIRGPPPPESKAWFTQHVAQRRAQATANRERLRDEARTAKEEDKAARQAEKAAVLNAKMSLR